MALANKYIIFPICKYHTYSKILLHEQCNIVLHNIQVFVRRVCILIFSSEKHFCMPCDLE